MREGEKNGRAKLDWEMVERIRALYAKGGTSTLELAFQYDMSQSTMHDIVSGKAWKAIAQAERKP